MGTTVEPSGPAPNRATKIPLWVKLLFTAFVAVLVPKYWLAYGPTNFLYFCDFALFMTVAAVWLESPLLASAPLVGIFGPQLLWQVDFLGSLVGLPITHMTDYMFNPKIELFARGLSFFHFWLPIFLIWLVYRLGYEPKALPCWTASAWTLMLVCYFFMPPAMPVAQRAFPDQPVNIDYVYNPLGDNAPQEWMPQPVYLIVFMLFLLVVFYWPTHVLFKRLCGAKRLA